MKRRNDFTNRRLSNIINKKTLGWFGMGSFTVPIAIMFIFSVIFYEMIRKKTFKIDFLTLINFVFVLCFGILPIYLYFFGAKSLQWQWVNKNQFDSDLFFYAQVVMVVGYLSIIGGYYFFNKSKYSKNISIRAANMFGGMSDKKVFRIGLLMSCIGIVSLLLYIRELGGLNNYLKMGVLLRGNQIEIGSAYLFLIQLAPFTYVGGFIFYALMKDTTSKNYLFYSRLFFLVSFLASLLILYHRAGRMGMFSYLSTFLVAKIIRDKKVNKRYLAFVLMAFVVLVIYGREIFNLVQNNQDLENRVTEVRSNTGGSLESMLLEFSFPIVSLANTINIYPEDHSYRYFVDVVAGLSALLPSKIINISITGAGDLNTSEFTTVGAIPLDIISMGYVSLGIAGVMIYCTMFGIFVSFLNHFFVNQNRMLPIIILSQWLILVCFMVMYGDPKHIVFTGLPLTFTTLLLIFIDKTKTKTLVVKNSETNGSIVIKNNVSYKKS